jgi:hypothetical protein
MFILREGKTNWKYISIVLILAVVVGGGILGWIKRQEVSFPKLSEIKKPAVYSLKSSDGFSIEVYKDKKLLKEITKDEIIKEWLKKYGGNIELHFGEKEYWAPEKVPDVCGFEGGCFLAASFVNRDSIEFIYDSKHQWIILPITFVEAWHMVGWDFYILDLSKNQFYIVPGERVSMTLFPFITTSPSHFIISPNNRYLAYVYGYAGGTCTYQTYPAIIDLEGETFPYDKKIEDKILDAIEEKWEKFVINSARYVPQQILPEVKDISWDLNNKINITFTSRPCGDIWDHLTPDAPKEIEIKLYLEPFSD